MNHDKNGTSNPMMDGSDIINSSLAGGSLGYDETELLSKMFTKDHHQNRSGYLHHLTENTHPNVL